MRGTIARIRRISRTIASSRSTKLSDHAKQQNSGKCSGGREDSISGSLSHNTLEANMADIEVDEMNVEGTERVSTVVRPNISVSKDKGKTWQKVGGKVDSGADSVGRELAEPPPFVYRYMESGRDRDCGSE